jgi:hypothetical protein
VNRRRRRTDLVCSDDLQVGSLAAQTLAVSKLAEYRVRSVTVDPMANPALIWPHVLGRRIRDRVTVIVPFPGRAASMTFPCHIAGIDHTISRKDWSTRFTFESATPFLSFAASTWGAGVWDTATWFF